MWGSLLGSLFVHRTVLFVPMTTVIMLGVKGPPAPFPMPTFTVVVPDVGVPQAELPALEVWLELVEEEDWVLDVEEEDVVDDEVV